MSIGLRIGVAACLVAGCASGVEPDTSNAVWNAEFQGRPHSVLPVERCFVPNVKICGGLPDEPLLEALMTAIHHDAVGKRCLNGRLVYTQMAIDGAALEKRAEWLKGEPLNGEEKQALERLYSRHARGSVTCIPNMRKGSTWFASQATAMKDAVFGWWFDIPKAVRNLEEKNAWRMDVERYESPSFDLFCRALNKHCVPILTPRAKRRADADMLLAIGACSSEMCRYVIVANPVKCGLGLKSYFDSVNASSPEWGQILAPPGSSSWNTMQENKGWMRPSELVVSLFANLPKGCSVLAYDGADWDMTLVKDMRPAWVAWQPEIDSIVVAQAQSTNSPTTPTSSVPNDETRWKKYFMGRESFAASNMWDVVSGVRYCATAEGVSPFAAAFATVACRSHPNGVGIVERGYEWRRVVQFTCEERWRRVSDEERSAMIALFHGALMASSPSVEYCNGERLWSVDEAGAKRLRELFATATNGVALGKIAPAEGNTTLQQVVHRLVPLEGNGDPVSLAMSRIADRYGWDATVERMGKPLFAALKKAFEMEIPVLLQTKAGGWVVGAGFLVEGNVPYVLVIDSATVKPEPRVPEASVEEHDNRMALSPATPGHVKYVVAATKSKYVEDRLLDARRELPEGCRFVPMAGEPFASAYFIHDWSPSVCCKDKIRELVATTKPVQEAPGAMFWPARKPVIQKP